MLTINATQVRKDWSAILDTVTREKPIFIKRTRDEMFLANIGFLDEILSLYKFHANIFVEENGSITISLDEIDLVENAPTERDAIHKLAASIHEYSQDYYEDYGYWAKGHRKAHMPYVFKALMIGDIHKIGGLIECRHGGT